MCNRFKSTISVYLYFFMLIFSLEAFSQTNSLYIDNREYSKENGKWFITGKNTVEKFEVDTTSMTVKLIDTTMTSSLDILNKESDIEIIRKNKLGYIDLRIPEKKEFTAVLKNYLNTNLFESVEMNSYGKIFEDDPDDPGYSSQHHLSHSSYPDITRV